MEKISVVIPNYNGAPLLKKNLPLVIKYCQGCEIIVVDDASTDDSVKLLRAKFKKIKLIKLKRNLGFSGAINSGINTAKMDKVLLLNSDITPKSNFVGPALNHFKSNDTFAVGLSDYSHEKSLIIQRGRGAARFRKGFVQHFAAHPERGITLWASGGSALIDRKKLVELNGFDEIYKPFYWEDIDLGFRAWRSGYKSYFEPLSRVDHFHEEGAIKKTYSLYKIKSISYKNQFLFFWKNIQNWQLVLMHFLWLPYHFVFALKGRDWAFFNGFLLALLSLPRLVWFYRRPAYVLSEKEVLNYFVSEH